MPEKLRRLGNSYLFLGLLLISCSTPTATPNPTKLPTIRPSETPALTSTLVVPTRISTRTSTRTMTPIPTKSLTPTREPTIEPTPTEIKVIPKQGDLIIQTQGPTFSLIRLGGVFSLDTPSAIKILDKNKANCTPNNSCIVIDQTGTSLILSRPNSAPGKIGYPESRTRFVDNMCAISYAMKNILPDWNLDWKHEIAYVVAVSTNGSGDKFVSVHESPEAHHQATIFNLGKVDVVKVLFDDIYPLFLLKTETREYHLYRLIPGIQQIQTDCSGIWQLTECQMRIIRKTGYSLQLVPLSLSGDSIIENMEIIR